MTVVRRLVPVVAGALAACSAAPIALATEPLSAGALSRTALVSGSLAPQLEPFPVVTFAPGLVVPIAGAGIAAGQQVDVGGQWSPVRATPAGGLGFALPSVPAGTHPVVLGSGDPPAPIPGTRAQSLVVRPTVTGATAGAGQVRVTLAPFVVANQTVALQLVDADPSSGVLSTRIVLTAVEADSALTFTLPTGDQALPPGAYLAFVSVDGVASAGSSPAVQLPASS